MLRAIPAKTKWQVDCLKQFGDFTLAYATRTDPKLQFFGDQDGYIAYRKYWKYTYVLGDPLTSDANKQSLLEDFLQQNPGSVFCQVSECTAQCLQKMGYWINEMGVDTWLDLTSYQFRGSKRAGLRYSANWLASHGYEIAEVSIDAELRHCMWELIKQWRTLRVNKREVVFLNRQVILEDEEDVRKFVLRDRQGQLQAFVFFDPLYRSGKVIGYVTAIKRRASTAPSYAEMGICKRAIEIFQSEGKQILRLGLSPLAKISDNQFRFSRTVHYAWRYLHRAFWVNRFIYNFKGHAQFKARFGGVEQKVYFASPVYFNSLRILSWLRMMQLI